MRVVEDRFNVELRDDGDGSRLVVFAFPYNAHIVAAVRNIPHRRFDWDAREWRAPASDWAGVHVGEILERFPELTTTAEVDDWLSDLRTRWVGYVRTARFDGRGWWLLKTHAGTIPASLRSGAVENSDGLLVPFTAEAAEAIRTLGSGRVSLSATRCLELVELGENPPPARLVSARGGRWRAAHRRDPVGRGDRRGVRPPSGRHRQRPAARPLARRRARCVRGAPPRRGRAARRSRARLDARREARRLGRRAPVAGRHR